MFSFRTGEDGSLSEPGNKALTGETLASRLGIPRETISITGEKDQAVWIKFNQTCRNCRYKHRYSHSFAFPPTPSPQLRSSRKSCLFKTVDLLELTLSHES